MEAFIGHPVWRMAFGGWNITSQQEEAWNEFMQNHNIKEF